MTSTNSGTMKRLKYPFPGKPVYIRTRRDLTDSNLKFLSGFGSLDSFRGKIKDPGKDCSSRESYDQKENDNGRQPPGQTKWICNVVD